MANIGDMFNGENFGYYAEQDVDAKIKGKKNEYLNGKKKPSNTVSAYEKITKGLAKAEADRKAKAGE